MPWESSLPTTFWWFHNLMLFECLAIHIVILEIMKKADLFAMADENGWHGHLALATLALML